MPIVPLLLRLIPHSVYRHPMGRLILLLPLLFLLAAALPLPTLPGESKLAEGVIHRRIITDRGEVVNLLLITPRDGALLTSVQGEDRYDGLEDLRALYQRLQRDRTRARILAVINGGSWRYDRMTPVGPLVAGGELVDTEGFHAWPSLVISSSGRAAIGTTAITTRIQWKHRNTPIDLANRRSSHDGIVLYNHFGGTVPARANSRESQMQRSARVQYSIGGASPETNEIDSAALLRDLRMSSGDRGLERTTLKLVCIPVAGRQGFSREIPLRGDTIPLLVQGVTTDTATVPSNGYVISLGSAARDMFGYVSTGDTVRLMRMVKFTGDADLSGISEVVTGSPLLVRNGIVESLDGRDGIRPEYFYSGALARTAAGTSRNGDTIMIATIDAPDEETGRRGVDLPRLAELMHSLGAWNALALESGAASGMVIDGVAVGGDLNAHEKVNNALVIMNNGH